MSSELYERQRVREIVLEVLSERLLPRVREMQASLEEVSKNTASMEKQISSYRGMQISMAAKMQERDQTIQAALADTVTQFLKTAGELQTELRKELHRTIDVKLAQALAENSAGKVKEAKKS